MKITTNILRNVCGLFLVLRDQAEAEGLTKAYDNAQKQYRLYRELLNQAYEKRPSGVGSGRPSHWKIIVKTSLPLTGGDSNCGKESEIRTTHRTAPESSQVIPRPICVSLDA